MQRPFQTTIAILAQPIRLLPVQGATSRKPPRTAQGTVAHPAIFASYKTYDFDIFNLINQCQKMSLLSIISAVIFPNPVNPVPRNLPKKVIAMPIVQTILSLENSLNIDVEAEATLLPATALIPKTKVSALSKNSAQIPVDIGSKTDVSISILFHFFSNGVEYKLTAKTSQLPATLDFSANLSNAKDKVQVTEDEGSIAIILPSTLIEANSNKPSKEPFQLWQIVGKFGEQNLNSVTLVYAK